MATLIHCVACANAGIDCVDQPSARSRACQACADGRKNCKDLPAMAHIAYAVWTRAPAGTVDDAHADLKKVLKAHKALEPLQAAGLLSAPVASEVTGTVINAVAQQGQTAGGVPAAFVLGARRHN